MHVIYCCYTVNLACALELPVTLFTTVRRYTAAGVG